MSNVCYVALPEKTNNKNILKIPRIRTGFKCVAALGRIIIRGPYPPSNAIIYMHLQL